ncbi:fimbria/pilus outer membrane usher protein, partial [Pluralibacter gergoviae]|nr:fimbria/pilus outer membrane usher protein [Pluralibacter gergoviae]
MRTLVLPGLRCTALPLALIAAAGQPAFADDVIFDAEALSAQGLDAGLAGQFRQAARFPPGVSAVALFVNGESRGRLQVTFDSQGRLCPDTALLRQAGLKIPAGFPDGSGGREDACRDLRAFWPQLSAIPSPADATLTLLVPQSALEPRTDNARWQHDGTAALLNYAAQLMGSRAPGSRMNYWQIQTELGFNAGDWIVRSNQNLYRFGQKAQTDYQNAYARRTFTGLKSTLQLGQIPLSGGLFGIGQVLGVQMTPEQALYGKSGSAVVAGVADTPSVVEIRQLGVPVFHTTVPAGPFSLSGFSLLNTRSDLSVTVTGADGGVRRYLVSAAAYARDGAVITPGISWGLGRYDLRGADKKP